MLYPIKNKIYNNTAATKTAFVKTKNRDDADKNREMH